MRSSIVTGERHREETTMLDRRRFFAAASAALLPALYGRRAAAQSAGAADFYRGKTVRMLVGSPPGGGYDLYARLIAPHLAAKLQATVLVENKAGSGGVAAGRALLGGPGDRLPVMHARAAAAVISPKLAPPGGTRDGTRD